MADEQLIDILTKITRIQDGVVVVKATINLNGNTYEEHGTCAFDPSTGIINATEAAEDIAVERAKKLAGIKDE